MPFRSPTPTGEPETIDLARVQGLLAQAEDLITELMQQNMTLRAERDEARQSVRLTATMLAGEAPRTCVKCRQPFLGLGKDKMCRACRKVAQQRSSQKRYALLKQKDGS